MTDDLILAIDQGTTGSTIALMDTDGLPHVADAVTMLMARDRRRRDAGGTVPPPAGATDTN